MPQDKAVHCGKSFFNKSHYAGSMLPKLRAQTPHTEMELHVKVWNSPRLLFDGSAGQGTYRIPAIMWMFLFSSQHSSVTTVWEVTQKKQNDDLFVHPRTLVLVSVARALTCIRLHLTTAKVNGILSAVFVAQRTCLNCIMKENGKPDIFPEMKSQLLWTIPRPQQSWGLFFSGTQFRWKQSTVTFEAAEVSETDIWKPERINP